MKKFLTTICAALVLCFVLSGTVTEAKTAEYKNSITTDYRDIWSNGTSKIYLNKAGTKLCEKNIKTGKVTVLKTLKTTADISYRVANVYGNQIYLNRYNILDSDVYVYNKADKTFKRAKKALNIVGASGKYMLAIGYVPSDPTPYTAWIYQANGNALKKIKTLGQNISGMKIVNGKVYYASYTTTDSSSLENMKVYTCDLKGQNKKLLFSKKAESKSGYVMVEEFNEDNIIFVERDNESDASTEYIYDLTTGEIQEVNE